MLKKILIFFLAATCAALHAKPNLVIINVDDLGYGDTQPFGSPTATPELMRMAAEGRKITNFYAAVVCSPSRAGLMTGCYPKRVLPIPTVLFPDAAIGLNPDEVTIAEQLRDAGYTTAMIGKWHLGDQPEFMPRRQGFDYYFGLPYSNDMGPIADGAKSSAGQPLPKPKAPRPGAPLDFDEGGFKRKQPPLALVEGEKVIGRIRTEEQSNITKLYTTKALEFLHAHAADNQPFFLYFAHNAVHFPHYPDETHLGKSGRGLLPDRVQEMDWSVGQVLATLRELKLDRNTLVLFMSDNGGAIPHGSSNAPLRGSKTQTLEGGIRTPAIAWWPGKIPAGTSTEAIVGVMDILPTFVHLAGAQTPASRRIDGVDVWPALVGAAQPRDNFFYFNGLKLEAVRSGPWKLNILNGHLYQLANDIGEAQDVAAANPTIVKKLKTLATTMENDLGMDGMGPGVRPLGRVEHPQPLIDMAGNVREEYRGTVKSFP